MRTINTSKDVDSLLDFIIVEKAPFGFKPLGSLFGGGDKKPSSEEDDEEKVPEGNRVYVDSKEEAPEGVEVLTGKRGGFFYDMSSLTEEEHGDEITNVFNNLMDELTEAQTPEAIEARSKKFTDLMDSMLDIRDNFKKQHSAAKKHDKASAEYEARQSQIIEEGSAAGKDFLTETIKTLESDKKLSALDSKKKKLQDKISRDMVKAMVKNKEYQSLQDQVTEGREKGDTVVGELHSKLGNALIHSFKSSPFKVDDMAFSIDPDMSYTDDPEEWEDYMSEKVQTKVEEMVRDFPDEDKILALQGSALGEWESAADDTKVVAVFMGSEKGLKSAEELGVPGSKRQTTLGGIVRDMRQEISENSLGAYDGSTNSFKASPNVWAKVSKMGESGDIAPEMKSALHVIVHESLHSMGHEGRHDKTKSYMEGRKNGLAEAGIPIKEAYHNISLLMEEGPVELLSQSIMGRKYNKDLVGKDVFTDKAFSEGSGSRSQHPLEGYQSSVPHIARWALAHSGGSPTRARALLGKMREVGSGKGEVDSQGKESQSGIVDNHRLQNEYTASYSQYLSEYQKSNPDKAHHVTHIARGLSEGQDNKYGKPKLPNLSLRPEIRGAKPTHDDDGSISEAGHLDVMHLIYGED
tara:strand:- start:2217 stop:4121 length:1905 start_codon:yes stop_codon:yes gene_type:complete